METERITLSQRELGRWEVLHKVQQMHLSQGAAGSRARNERQTHLFELLALSISSFEVCRRSEDVYLRCLRALC